ncbi:thioredoxin-related transmembrane protein 1-like [Ylistrum balloti]|uniref:thioredoxin-related transmembrane protein 1-like n=1 Tax=Ylistrum balloti TaxID=509963 RepID=UPI002905D487|nr:thioredoxin-related transmembrane protein 1-like [Ylistrum balloti]
MSNDTSSMKAAFRNLILLCLISACLCGQQSAKPLTINENNWTQSLEGEWMVEFMAPWCPACRAFTETWASFAKWGEDFDFKVGVVDVTENPGLSGRFLVSALPTVYHVKDGVFRQYKGGRKENELVSFIDEKKWEEIEPVVWYLSPSSVQMGAVGFFFKAAMQIRALYNVMTAEYGIPEWACYVIFAVMTISLGLILGLLIVCCCDMVFPTKYLPPLPPQERLVTPQHPEEDLESQEDTEDDDSQTEDILDDTQHSQSEEEAVEEEEEEETGKATKEESKPEPTGDAKPRRRRPKKAD